MAPVGGAPFSGVTPLSIWCSRITERSRAESFGASESGRSTTTPSRFLALGLSFLPSVFVVVREWSTTIPLLDSTTRSPDRISVTTRRLHHGGNVTGQVPMIRTLQARLAIPALTKWDGVRAT